MQSLWLTLLLVPALASAAVRVQATLDRDTAQLGDTVTLNLRISGGDASGIAEPDLDALRQDFDILGTSQNSSLSVVNGAASSQLTFGVALRPRHVGVLQIPPLSVAGSQTAPLQLTVTPPDPATAAAAGQQAFMEAQVEPQRGYVGQQFSYVVRLYVAPGLSNGSLDDPKIGGAELSQVGGDLRYDTERAGRSYQVIERRYALVPQQAGHLDIPPLNFSGQMVDPNDPNSFFSGGTPVSASSPDLGVDVQAAPAGWGGSTWLPARELSLTMDGWPSAQQAVRVGQPLNLTMTLQATGLSQDALPALSLPPLDGATVYPDKPVAGDRSDGGWIVGRRQQAFAIVPERAGTLTIPATTLKWWNVLTDRMQVAQIPAHSLIVLPAIGAATTAAPGTPPSPVVGPASAGAPAMAAAPSSAPWRWLALGSLGLWLLSMLGWWLWRRRATRRPVETAASESASARQSRLAFLAAARGDDAALQLRSLLAWAHAERPAIRHAGELLQALGDERQRAAIAALQQRQYASAPEGGVDIDLADLFKRGFRWRDDAGVEADGDLPPLYPFKLD